MDSPYFLVLFILFIDNSLVLIHSTENTGTVLSTQKETQIMANSLDKIMNKEALSNSELGRLAQLSDKTISKIRKNATDGALNSQNKIIVGLNRNPNKVRETSYIREEIFHDGNPNK